MCVKALIDNKAKNVIINNEGLASISPNYNTIAQNIMKTENTVETTSASSNWSTNWLLSLILMALIISAWQLVGIKVTLMENANESSAENQVTEEILKVVGVKHNTFDGLGLVSGFVVEMPSGAYREIPFDKMLDVPASAPHRFSQGGWKPQHLAVLIEGGQVTAAYETQIQAY